jgi:hypothetical protein
MAANTFGYPVTAWNAARREAKATLADRARVRGMVPYSELVNKIQSIRFEPHDTRFFHFLGELSREEDAAGHGMITALVVHRHGDMQPGPGFFELAESLGKDLTDVLACWIREVHQVHSYWERNTSAV